MTARTVKKKKPEIFGKTMSFLHLWLGIVAGLVLFVVATTGGILTFEEELTPLLFSSEQKVQPSGTMLSPDSLVSIAKTVYPDKKIARLYLPQETEHSIKATFGSKKKGLDYVYINPYTGKILSKGKESKRFFVVVLNLHRFLLAGKTGKTITGISCAITFFMTLSGLYLWWPKNKKILKQRLQIKTDASFKRVNWDLHAVSGFYASIFLVVITLTGLVWSYTWVEDLLFKITDGKKEKVAEVKQSPEKIKKADGLYASIVAQTNKVYPHSGGIILSFPEKNDKPVVVSKENQDHVMVTSDQVYFDSRNGQMLDQKTFSSLSLGSQIRKMNKPIHTGSILGWPTKLIAFLTTLICASLPITGFMIYLGRGKKKKKQQVSTI
nr:PepSY-associated TM helix domain-containing protein [Pedobacter sp. ASV2]